jgi:hypothetical protein
MEAPATIPYVVGQWVRSGRFYGRDEVLSEVLEGPRESLWLLGTRRIGKTSVLKQLEHRTTASNSDYVPLFWDFQGADEPSELHLSFHDALLDAEERLEEHGVDLGAMDAEDLYGSLARLRRRLRSTGKRVLLLCDEVEELIKLHIQDPSILRKLRRALQSGGEVRSVLTSTIRLWALAEEREDTSPFLHGFTPPIYLATMTDSEARSLLKQEHLPETSRPSLEEDTVEILCEVCGNHPYLLQLMGKRYLEVGTVEKATELVATDEMVSYFFAVDFEMLSPVEQRILRAVGDTSKSSDSSLEDQLDLRASQVTGSLLRLENLGFLRRDSDRDLILANRFFQRWLAELPQTSSTTSKSAGSAESDLLDDRYEILEMVGEGATGVVYLANDRLLGDRAVAGSRPSQYTAGLPSRSVRGSTLPDDAVGRWSNTRTGDPGGRSTFRIGCDPCRHQARFGFGGGSLS